MPATPTESTQRAEQADFSLRIFNSTDSHMAIVGADGIILMVNESWQRFARESRGEKGEARGVGANYFVEYDEQWGDVQLAREAFEGIRNVQCGALSSFSQEYPCHIPEGEKRWFLMKVLSLQGEQGTVLISHTDISRYKLIELALIEKNAAYQTLLSTTSDGYWLTDLNGTLLDVNDAYIRLSGYSREELLTMNIRSLDVHESAAETTLHIQRLAETGGDLFESKHRRKDGSIWDVEVSTTCSPLQGGQLYVFLRDISERIRVVTELVEQRSFLADLIEHSGMLIAVKDRDGRYELVNRKWQEVTGLVRTEVLGKSDEELFPAPVGGQLRANDLKVLSSGQCIEREESIEDEVHGIRYGISTKFPLKSAGGSVRGVCVMSADITARKLAEQKLNDAKNYIQALLDTSPVGIATYSVAGDALSANDAIARIVGATRENLLKQNFRAIDSWKRSGLLTMAEHALSSGIEQRGDISLTSSFNKQVDMDCRCIPFMYVGAPHLMLVAIDITGRKRMEEEIRAAHDKLELMTAAVPGVVYQFMFTASGEWKFTYVSNGLKDLFEIEPEAALQDCDIVTRCIVPEDRVSHRESVEISSQSLSLWVHEHRICTPGGTLKWVKGQAMPQQQDDGSVLWNGILIDITDRKRMEFEKVALAAVVENSDNIIVCKDMDLRVVATNMAYVQASGHASVSEMIGKTDAEIFGVSIDTEPIRTYMEDDRRAQQMLRGEIIIREETVPLPTGETKIVLTRKYPVYTPDGNLIGTGNISTDITELKRAEVEKLLLQQQLQQSQRLESLGVLAGGIAHDFNNILAVIVGNCFLAKMHPEEAENNISTIEKASERAAELCRQMLAYAGKGPCIKTLVNMGTLVDEMVTMLKATINQNAAITLDRPATLPAVNGDASQLRQIVMNLIINAAEAIGEAQGDVRVSLVTTMITVGHTDKDYFGKAIKPGSYLCLQVSDSGCGMDDETMRKIFEPFFSTKFAGRGLGMSALLGIISAHEGAVQLTSQPGQGTTVTVYLPAQEDEAEKAALIQPIAPVPWQGSGTILLAEDEEQLLSLATFMLQDLGFTVIAATNGKEALALYRQHAAEITLVMTDIGMPIMDGYELFHELKKEQQKLPIIISSGFGDTVITARIPREEIAGLVSKPYTFAQLREVVRSVVEKE